MNTIATLERISQDLQDARETIEDLQRTCLNRAGLYRPEPNMSGQTLWLRLETLDDQLFEALEKLGT